MSEVIQHVAKKIRELRIAAGYSQTELAKKLKIAPNTISRWESGAYKPRIDDLDRLARLFGTPIWAFFPSDVQPANEAQRALLSATGDLPSEDIDELRRFVDFVRAGKALRKK